MDNYILIVSIYMGIKAIKNDKFTAYNFQYKI